MEGQQYLTINPDTLNDRDLWSFRDLQLLCVKLSLGGKGSRIELEDKLRQWHRIRNEVINKEPHEELIPMNVSGNNFALLQIHVTERSERSTLKRRRSSILNIENDYKEPAPVSPTILRPLRNENTTPGKSILKRQNSIQICGDENDHNCNNNINNGNKLAKLKFSPFNGVKVIAHRYDFIEEYM
jgi:hypothetical protein